MYPVIDIHSHFLPFIDDGSHSIDESIAMLHEMKRQGIDIVAATPHYHPGKWSINDFLEARWNSYLSLKPYIDDLCPKITLGSEVAFHFGISQNSDLDKLCIIGTNVLLLEMPVRSEWTDYELAELDNLIRSNKFRVVIAHYERYRAFQKNSKYYHELLSRRLFVQMNASSVINPLERKEVFRIFEQKRAHILASDSHNMGNRAPNIEKARKIISKKFGPAFVYEMDRLCFSLCKGDL